MMPMRLSENTPDRADSDPVLILELDHCSSPDCSCGKPRLQDLLESLVETNEVTHAQTSQCTTSNTIETTCPVELGSGDQGANMLPQIGEYIIGGINSDGEGIPSASHMLSLQLQAGFPLRRQRRKNTKPEGDEYEHPMTESNIASSKDHHMRFHTSDDFSKGCPICRAALQRRKAARRESGGNHAQAVKSGAFGDEILLDTID